MLTAKLYYLLMENLSDTKIPRDVGDFRLMDRAVVEKIKKMRERHRFLRGMISWVGFKQTFIKYNRNQRSAGQTKYPLKKMISFAFDGIFSFSTVPVKYTIYMGIFTTVLSFIGIVVAVVARLVTDGWVSGWTTLIMVILFLGGIQLISIGILGQYVSRIFEEIKDRPLYIVEKTINFE